MKTQVLRTSIMALVAAAVSYAQGSLPLHFDVPFNFIAGDSTLTAGRYIVDQGIQGVLVIRSADSKRTAVLSAATTCDVEYQPTSTLLFHRYGDTYLLSQVWTEGNNCGRQPVVTSRERELMARNKVSGVVATIAIRR